MFALARGPHEWVEVNSSFHLTLRASMMPLIASLSQRAVPLTEGLWLMAFYKVEESLRGVLFVVVGDALTNEVLLLAVGRARVVRGAAHAQAVGGLVVLAHHLLVKQLVGHAGQTVELLFLPLQLRKLVHATETAVENDFGLDVGSFTLELEGRDLALFLEDSEQVRRLDVYVTKDDPFVALVVRESQLLEGDLVLVGHAYRQQLFATVLFHVVVLRFRRGWGRSHRWFGLHVANGLERHVFYLHGHRDRVGDLLEGFGLEGLGRLHDCDLAVVENGRGPLGNSGVLGQTLREAPLAQWQCRFRHVDWARTSQCGALPNSRETDHAVTDGQGHDDVFHELDFVFVFDDCSVLGYILRLGGHLLWQPRQSDVKVWELARLLNKMFSL